MIPYVNLKKQYAEERKELLKIIDKTLASGLWVGGNEVEKFEKKIQQITNSKYCIALNSGTDALTLGLHLLNIKKGDEVITAPNSFIASTAVIIHLGAKPIFVDVKDDQNIDERKIEKLITKKTKAIMPIHLTGRVCTMNKILKISKKYKIPIIEDCAQSILSKFNNKHAGTWGDVGCFSTHPLKNLNATGDGGFVITNNKNIYSKMKNLRSHGMESNRDNVEEFGYVSRMDNIQAVILNYRIKNLKKIIKKRRKNVKLYLSNLNLNKIFFPLEKKEEFNTYHTFVIQVEKRDELKLYLKNHGILSTIHYPIPIHKQKSYLSLNTKYNECYPNTEKQAKRILSLPINQYLTEKEIVKISKLINKFYN